MQSSTRHNHPPRIQHILNHLNPPPSLNVCHHSDSEDHASMNHPVIQWNTTSAESQNNNTCVIYQQANSESGGIVVLYLNDGPVNALSDRMLKAIKMNMERANNDDQCKGIVIASKLKGFFVAGADITEIRKRQVKQSSGSNDKGEFLDFLKNGNSLMNFIENSPKNKPVVACIDGVALGGGLELAMACNGRVCTENSTLGLPETNLGIIPGYGGCNRLPRLVGTRTALEMMISTQPVKGKQAQSLGLVDVCVVDSSSALSAAHQLCLEMIQGQRAIRKTLQFSQKLLQEDDSLNLVNAVESKLDAIQSKLPHLKALLRVVRETVQFPCNGLYGLDVEMKEFAGIANQPISRGMVHYFLAQKATTKLPKRLLTANSNNTTTATTTTTTTNSGHIKSLAVIGGGTMGANIVVNALENGIRVILKEINQDALKAGMERIRKVFQSKLDRKKMTQQQFDKIFSQQLVGQITFDSFNQVDMVIEAVLEIVELKQKIFLDLEKHCNDKCILATNTSTIDLNRISEKMQPKNRSRVIGLHYFTPAHVMPLLEIVRTEHTSPQVLMTSLSFAKQVKKTPVVVLNVVGFAVNRIFWPYGIAAQYLVERGLSPYQIDKAISQSVMRVGFFTMADMSGLDVLNYASQSIAGAYKERAKDSPFTKLMIEAKRLGEKTNIGIYKYDANGKKTPDPEGMEPIIAQVRKAAGSPSPLNYTDKDIYEACLFNAVNEACRVIEDKVVFRVSDIDVASVMAMGFMHFYGGLMKWADELGAKYVYDRLNKFYQDSDGKIVSFKPCQYLTHCATNNLSLYSADSELMQ